MAALTVEHIFRGNIEQVFAGCRQYGEYPKYLPGVSAIEVQPAQVPGSSCRVRYDIKLIKTFYYTLNTFEKPPAKIWWNLSESNLMKKSEGSWQFEDLGDGTTKAIYTLDVGFSGLVPQKIVDQVTRANLPALMSGMQKLIDAQNGK